MWAIRRNDSLAVWDYRLWLRWLWGHETARDEGLRELDYDRFAVDRMKDDGCPN